MGNIKRALKQRSYFLRYLKKSAVRSAIQGNEAQENIMEYHYAEKPVFQQDNELHIDVDLMIVISTYNNGKYIEECLNSVIKQEGTYSYHITIVNDGSTDNTREVLEKYIHYKNITIMHQENQGAAEARNRALKNINGKYVMFLDSDDMLPEKAIQKFMDTALQYDADLVEGGFETFWDDGKRERTVYCDSVKKVPFYEIHSYAGMRVIRSELLKKFCFPKGFYYEDIVILKLLAPLCKRVYFIPDVIYRYRMHTTNTSIVRTGNYKVLDTFWLTKYCLEEMAERKCTFGEREYVDYLQQCWLNWFRTKELPGKVQESMFVLTCDLYRKYFEAIKLKNSAKKYKWLDHIIKKKSYDAYVFVMQRWDSI